MPAMRAPVVQADGEAPEAVPQLQTVQVGYTQQVEGQEEGGVMPNNQALQVFYGTLPLIGVIVGIWFREQILLKDILARLGRIEERLSAVEMKAWR